MFRLAPRRQNKQPQRGVTLSPLAKRLGFTQAFSFGGLGGGGNVATAPNLAASVDPYSNTTAGLYYLGGSAELRSGPGGIGLRAISSPIFTVLGAPFATSTCTYLWIESGIDSSGSGQALFAERTGGGETTKGVQIRIVGGDIQIIAAATAVELTGTGARKNDGRVNVTAASIAGNNGRHAIVSGGALINTSTPTITYTHGTSSTVGGATGVPLLSGITLYAFFFAPVALPDSVLADLTRNPWQLFSDIPPQFAVSTATDLSVGLTGVAGTGAVGTLTPAFSVPLVGSAGTGSTGTVAPNITIGLTGTEGAGVLGSVITGENEELTGVVGTGDTGTVSPNITIDLTGVEGSGAVGDMSASSPGEATLTGVEGASTTGTLDVQVDVPLTGTEGTGALGTVGVDITIDLTGVEGESAVGDVAAAVPAEAMLTGVEGTGDTGTFELQADVPLTGAEGTGDLGDVLPNITIGLTGVEAGSDVGVMTVPGPKTVALTGVGAAGEVGDLTPSSPTPPGPLDPKYLGGARKNIQFKPVNAKKKKKHEPEPTPEPIVEVIADEPVVVAFGSGLDLELLQEPDAPAPLVEIKTPLVVVETPAALPEAPAAPVPNFDVALARMEVLAARVEAAAARGELAAIRMESASEMRIVRAEGLVRRASKRLEAAQTEVVRVETEKQIGEAQVAAEKAATERMRKEQNRLRAAEITMRLLDSL